MNANAKLSVCKNIRQYAAQSLAIVLRQILQNGLQPSEAELRDLWLAELRRNSDLFPDGWYNPPPFGIGILIGNEEDSFDRVNFLSLRPEASWPRSDVYFDSKKSLVFAYASPFDAQTGIIGDFGLSLYFGKNEEIISHLRRCHALVQKVFDFVAVPKTFSEIATYQKQLITAEGFKNEIVCVTDPSAADDFGHTIPFIMENIQDDESIILNSGNYAQIKTLISKKRVFGRISEPLPLHPGMAFTIEPRPRPIGNDTVPMVYFHTIALIWENGKKELLTGFDELFSLAGMEYLRG